MPSDPRATAHDTLCVDGVLAGRRAAPGDAPEAAELLREAAAQGQSVVPVGGSTALGLGNPPESVDLLLSTERLAGIIDYEPTDLVLSVGAGANLGDVQAVLGEHGQRLPIDPPGGAEATIGGLIATARWGPLRYSTGTLRDLLIGISVAHTSGTVSKAGGMVVKNVSGYDMPRLYLGSLGTLGLITSANFKVLPRPRAEATILATYAMPEPAFADTATLRSGREPLAALEVVRRDGAWMLATRIEGRPQTVDAIASRVAASIEARCTRLDGDASAVYWRSYLAPWPSEPDATDIHLVCGVRPRATATLALGLLSSLGEIGIGIPHMSASPGLGVVTATLDFGGNGSPERLSQAQALILALAETATIVAAPAAWKQGLDVWGRPPEGFEVMQALRAQFDPTRTINPGRFAGFL